jgi:hypothetical protein
MNVRKVALNSIVGIGLVASGYLMAQAPHPDIDPQRHPNLAEAQRMILTAYNKISAAQQANEDDMHGHASHAKELLSQASNELKAAAEAANKNHH